MIPERIALKGFLSYDAEQVLAFDGAPLWLLAGPNGSGKSSVFDAITFCLFGGHRGGKDDYEDLINKRNDSGAVEFDFRLDGKHFRIRRTLKRKKAGGATTTQEVFQLHPSGDGGEWKAVPDTRLKPGFNQWVQENIGLNFETFTASVLLVQGKADNLLTCDPKDRHKMLARIIGLERYERLHAKVVADRNILSQRADILLNQLDGLPDVTDAELASAEQQIETADGAWQKARAEVERCQTVEALARRWAEVQAHLAKLAEQISRAETLLADSAAIERAWERLQELRAALPAVRRVVEQRERLAAAERELQRLDAEQRELASGIEGFDQALGQARQKRHQREQDIAADDERLRELAVEMQSLALALPQLGVIQRERERLRQARTDAETAAGQERQTAAVVGQCEAKLDPLARALADAEAARHEADHEVTRAETRLDETTQHYERFTNVVGDKMCRYCGQPITPEHAEQEHAKLKKELAEAQSAHEQAVREQAAKRKAENDARARHEVAAKLLAEARQQILACQHRRDKARADAERCAEACVQAYAELSAPFRAQIDAAVPADWLATAFPSASDLDDLKRKHASLQSEVGRLDRDVKTLRQQLTEDQKEEKRLEKERERLQQACDGIKGRRAVQEALGQTCRADLSAAAAEVPDAWQARAQAATAADLRLWQDECDSLRASDAESKHQELLRADLALQGLLKERHEWEARRDELPEEARRSPEEIGRLLADARREEKRCHDELVASRSGRQRFLDRREERRKLAEERADVLKQLGHHQLLAKYLDRDYLQRYLMRQAERTIVAYARDILDRLSDGQICLQQRNEDAGGGDKALVLEAYNRASAQHRPHRVEMLSGSERFRVAVSLALAIGQYASRQHRPIQSVIIDEGFGCLDPANRQLMIQELHNLQGQLHRILLVSHQDEFADAFTNGYRFERADGATRVRRFAP